MKRVVIFGATGFVGMYTTEAFVKAGYEVIATGRNAKLGSVLEDFGAKFIQLDITKVDDFEKLPKENVDAAILLAGLLPANTTADLENEENDIELCPVPDVDTIKTLYLQAQSKGLKLKYVATIDQAGKAFVGLRMIDSGNALYGLQGTGNAALITTDDYQSPLLIQGAGAGARQTAGGLLNDILLI